MDTLIYDGTFEGWLSAVFEVYERKFNEVNITVKEKLQPGFFGQLHTIETDYKKAARVWKGLQVKLSVKAQTDFYRLFYQKLRESKIPCCNTCNMRLKVSLLLNETIVMKQYCVWFKRLKK